MPEPDDVRFTALGLPLSEVMRLGLEAAELAARSRQPAVHVEGGRVVVIHEVLWGPCSRRALAEGGSVADVIEGALREYAGL